MAEENKKPSKLKNFLKGIIVENPLFVMVLGTCPSLATTTSIESAIGMGLLFSIVLVCSNMLISLVRKLISDEIRTPAYIVIIATFVTIVKMLANAFLPELYTTLGVFISLIVVNCVVLGRAEAYASKHNVLDSLLDGLGMGVGYTFALILMATCREILGTGMITFGKVFTFIQPVVQIPVLKFAGYVDDVKHIAYDLSMPIFTQPVGAFITFGLIMALIGFNHNRKDEKAAFMKRFASKVVPSVDDNKVNTLRKFLPIVTVVLACVATGVTFINPVNGYSVQEVFFGANNMNGNIPSFVFGSIMMFVAGVLACVSILFSVNWNLKYIWLNVASAAIALFSSIYVFTTADAFSVVNGVTASMGIGTLLGGIFGVLTLVSALANLFAPALLDSYIVSHPVQEVEVK